MAELAKIRTPDGVVYDLADATARDNFTNYLPTSGGNITGPLTVKRLHGTVGYTYITATDFANNPPSGTEGQILFVIQGV